VDKIKEIFLLFILFIYLVFQRLIEELGKLSIDSLTKINIFSMFHRNKKERFGKVLTRLSCGKWLLQTKSNRSFLLFILFIFLAVQRLIEDFGKLLIDSLAKINIFFFGYDL